MPKGTLVFEDNFNRLKSVWQTRLDYYLPGQSDTVRGHDSAVDIVDGKLNLRVKRDPENQSRDAYVTGHIGTKDRFEFTYGYCEARMRFGPNKGAHGAFWLQTTTDYVPGQAEIDIAENFGADKVWHNVYWREEWTAPGTYESAKFFSNVVRATDWHVYAVDWQPSRYDFYVDNVKVHTNTRGLTDQPKFLILSTLVRNWELEELALHPLRDFKTQVDYVKIWQQ